MSDARDLTEKSTMVIRSWLHVWCLKRTHLSTSFRRSMRQSLQLLLRRRPAQLIRRSHRSDRSRRTHG